MPQNCASLWHIQPTNLYETITIVDLMHNNTQSLFQHSTDIMADTVCIEQWYVCTRATSLSWAFSTDVLKACIHAVLHQYLFIILENIIEENVPRLVLKYMTKMIIDYHKLRINTSFGYCTCSTRLWNKTLYAKPCNLHIHTWKRMRKIPISRKRT